MSKSYVIPHSVKITAGLIEKLPELKDRIFRIIFVAISIGHIRDQYFKDHVSIAVGLIKKKKVISFKGFLQVIWMSRLDCFGRGDYGKRQPKKWHTYYAQPINKRWWRQVWNLIDQNGDIELIVKGE